MRRCLRVDGFPKIRTSTVGTAIALSIPAYFGARSESRVASTTADAVGPA